MTGPEVQASARPCAQASSRLSAAERARIAGYAADLAEHGAVRVPRALDEATLQKTQEAFEWSRAHPGPAAQYLNTPEGIFFNDTNNIAALPVYRKLLQDVPLAEIAATLLGVDRLWFLHEQLFIKEGGAIPASAWHQDSSYLPFDGRSLGVMWISFDSLTYDEALHFIDRSHAGPMYNGLGDGVDSDGRGGVLYPHSGLPRFPDVDAHPDQFRRIGWSLDVGDILFFLWNTMHGGAPIPRGRRRRTLSLRFFGPDAVLGPRPSHRTSGSIQSVDATGQAWEGLAVGDPLSAGQYFPQVYPTVQDPAVRAGC